MMGAYQNISSFNNFQPSAGTLSPTGSCLWSSAWILIEIYRKVKPKEASDLEENGLDDWGK